VQMWNRYKQTTEFQAGKPWLLRFFDQIKFYPVSGQELLRLREAFIEGKVQLDIRPETFSLRQYNDFLRSHADTIAAFKTKQQAAFTAERDRWATAGEFDRPTEDPDNLSPDTTEIVLPPDTEAVVAHASASIWKLLVKPGDVVAEGDRLIILEAMKMEIAILAESAGTIIEVFCTQGQTVTAGQILMAIGPLPSSPCEGEVP
jgi:urea carboxylase